MNRVQKFRSLEDMARAAVVVLPGDGFERFARHCARYFSIAPRTYPRGVFRYRTIEEAQAATVFPIAVPKLGDDWHASSATWTKTAAGGTLRIGYVDPDDNPVQLIESNTDSQTLARTELTASAAQIDRYSAGGRTWALYTGRPGEQGLVLFDQGRTIVILGKAKAEKLEALAASLS